MREFTEEYRELVEKVRAIDPAAAEYMLTGALDLPSFSGDAQRLDEAFIWSHSPHGHKYWQGIYGTIIDKEYENET